MKYGVAIFPEKKIQDIANSYRKRYDPHYSLIPPHITLKDPFDMAEKDLPAAIDHLEKVAKETEPFEICFHKVSSFYPTNNVVYLSIQDRDALTRLHEKINSGMLYHEHRYSFIPHLTIGQKLPEDELHDVYGSLRMKEFNLKTTVDRFHLLYQLENGSWSIYQTFVFNK